MSAFGRKAIMVCCGAFFTTPSQAFFARCKPDGRVDDLLLHVLKTCCTKAFCKFAWNTKAKWARLL